MPKKLVDVFDRSGGKLFTYSIALEDEECLDAEFEEVALVFAESSGLVAVHEVVHLRAGCCEPTVPLRKAEAAAATPAKTSAGRKPRIVSLLKHRMKRADSAPERHRIRHAS